MWVKVSWRPGVKRLTPEWPRLIPDGGVVVEIAALILGHQAIVAEALPSRLKIQKSDPSPLEFSSSYSNSSHFFLPSIRQPKWHKSRAPKVEFVLVRSSL